MRAAFADVVVESVAGGWEDRWKEFHRPVRRRRALDRPAVGVDPPGRAAVVVDPGRAFGTGAHPTTRACIELLARLERGRLLDAGCGSGVVAVAAARLGFGPSSRSTLDDVAVEVAAGRLGGTASTSRSDADVLVDELAEADVVVANIELGRRRALLERAGALAVTSGYLASETPAAGWPGWSARARAGRRTSWAADVSQAAGRSRCPARH